MVNDIQKEKLPASRSSRFPSLSLPYAISVVSDASRFGTNITDSHLAGNTSPKGGTFGRKKASLKYYGLIETEGEKIRITALAEKILRPVNDKEKVEGIREAFLKPELFNKLYISTQKNIPIEISLLGNILLREYGVQPAGKNEFISTLIKSGIFANLIKYNTSDKNEIIFLDPQGLSDKKNIVETEEKRLPLEMKEDIGDDTDASFPEEQSEEQIVKISLSQGRAKIIVPKQLTEEDIKKLKAQINILGNIFDEG